MPSHVYTQINVTDKNVIKMDTVFQIDYGFNKPAKIYSRKDIFLF